MNQKEKAVRDAANALAIAIADARSVGLHIRWPRSPEELGGIAISETKNAADAPAPAARKTAKSA